MRIMVVDDSRTMRMIVMQTLQLAGFRSLVCAEAGNGLEAFEAIKADPPDLVLSDWNMPELSGIELLKKIRASGSDLKFGFVTSESTVEARKAARDAGALFLIAKPFTPDLFRAALEPVLIQ